MGRPADGRRHDDEGAPRLFVAVPVSDAARAAVADLLTPIRASVDGPSHRIRWVRLDGLHLTLRFFGTVPVTAAGELARVVDEVAAAAAPFRVELGGGGAFPSIARPRTLWLGLRAGIPDAAALASSLGRVLAAHGWPDDGRPFRAHLTIARTDGARAAPEAADLIAAAAVDWSAGFTADRLVVYRSHLGGGPARYEPLHEAMLGPA